VIQDFKEGKHNVLVSTSIGEEGLDIGEVDVIICYDTQKAAIKMVCAISFVARN
jgi:ATP-dependent DNA helicase MPH1